MGLFFNSDTQNKKDQVLRDIAIVNKALRNIVTILDDNGMNETTIDSIGPILGNVESNITRIGTTVQSMSDLQCIGFKVPWIDGSYIGITMWWLSLSHMSKNIQAEMESYLS